MDRSSNRQLLDRDQGDWHTDAVRRSRGQLKAGRTLLATAAALALLSVGCQRDERSPDSPSAQSQPSALTAPGELLEIPEPDLSGASDAVRQQIVDGRAELERLEQVDASPAEIASASGTLGLVYFTYSFVGAAEVCFRNAITLAPDDYRWSYLFGYLMKMQGRLELAEESLQRANQLSPDDRPTKLRLARVHLELSENERAGQLFEEVLQRDPQSAAALAGLGQVAATAGDHRTAADHFERVLEIQPSATSIHHALGLAYRRLGETDKARIHLEQGGDAVVQIDDPLLRSLVELGQSAEVYLVRAAQAMDAERWELATSLYPKALELDSSDFMTHKAYAFALEKVGDLEAALEQLDIALQVATTGDQAQDRQEHAEIYRVMGGIEVLHGREGDAIRHFRKSLELDPEKLDTRAKFANALGRAGQFDEALEHYDLVLARQPDSVPMLVARATVLVNLARPDDAVKAFEAAIAAAPEDATVREKYAAALDYLGRTQEAAQQRAAIGGSNQRSDTVEALFASATRLKNEGRYNAAIDKLDELLELDPNELDARYELASLLGHVGRFDQAVGEFARILETNSTHRLARRGEITALLLLERYADARQSLDQALKIMPRDRQLAMALSRLLATAPDATVRNGRLAVEIASRVFADGRNALSAETLAAAFAEVGNFPQALELQSQLVAAAESSGGPTAARLRQMHSNFEAGRPWRLSSPDEIVAILLGRTNVG